MNRIAGVDTPFVLCSIVCLMLRSLLGRLSVVLTVAIIPVLLGR